MSSHVDDVTASDTHARPTEDRTLGSLVSDLSGDLSTLMRQELALAKAELRDEAKKAGQGVGMLGGAAFCGWMTAIFVSLTAIWLIAKGLDLWIAALIVTAIWAIGGAVLALAGRKKLQQVNATPQQTVDSLKEDAQWLKAQTK